MDPGLMRHKIRVQKAKPGKNEFGEPDNVWEDVASIRASISPVSGREFMAVMQPHSEVTHKIVIRYNRNVTPQMRVVFGSRVFDILHIIDPWEMHQQMTLMCREVVT